MLKLRILLIAYEIKMTEILGNSQLVNTRVVNRIKVRLVPIR